MPRVPVYQPQVNPQRVQIPSQSLDTRGAFGVDTSGLAQGLGNVADDMLAVQRQKEEYAAKKSYRMFANQISDYLQNPDSGALYRQGEAALNLRDDYQKQAQQIRSQIGSRLKGNSKLKFEEFADTAFQSGLERVSTHERGEMVKMFDAEDMAILEQSVGDVVLYAGTGGADTALATINATVDSLATRKGIPKNSPQYENLRLEYTTKAHAGAIDNYLQRGNIDAAKEYFEKNKDDISSLSTDKINKAIQEHADLAFVQNTADEVSATLPTLSEQLSYVRKNHAGEREDAIIKAVKARWDEKEYMQNQAKEDEWGRALDFLVANRNNPRAMESILPKLQGSENKYKAIQLAESLRPKPTESAEAGTATNRLLAMNRIRRNIDAGAYKSDNEVLADAAMAGLTASQQSDILESYNVGGNKGELKQTTLDSVVKRLDPDGKGTDKYPGIFEAVQAALPPGAPVNDTTLTKLAAQFIAEGETPGGGIGYGRDETYLKASKSGRGRDWMPDVTREERDNIERILKTAGKPVNDKNIRLYKKHAMLGYPIEAQ
jgi:hypothetical protein